MVRSKRLEKDDRSHSNDGKGRPSKDDEQVALLVEMLALASIGESTKKEYTTKCATYRSFGGYRRKGPSCLRGIR